jgi:antitoxin CptB
MHFPRPRAFNPPIEGIALVGLPTQICSQRSTNRIEPPVTDRAHITDNTDRTSDGMCRTDARRRRILFRSWHRGTQEIDLLLGSFADDVLADFDSAQPDRFEALLDCNDVDLLDWITGRRPPPREYDDDVMRLLRGSHFHQKG